MSCPARGKGRHKWCSYKNGLSRCVFCGLTRKSTKKEIEKANRIEMAALKAFNKAFVQAFGA
jgi:Zn ribbon nucleic-acid-binding protein